jgi:hypothetical protein
MNHINTNGFNLERLSRQRIQNRLLAALLFMVMIIMMISGCSSTSSSSEGNGELVISLTDAEGDFLSYTVDVASLKMIRKNGAEVEALPLTTTLDFAQYVEVTEFLTAATVPSGAYTGAQITLDYTNAAITVQDTNGDAIAAAAVDTNGDSIGQLTVDITLNGGSEFVIAPGIPAHITLDFDLDASNTVTVNGDTATVVVSPVLIADTILEEPKPHRLRGVLGEVDEAGSSFIVKMRPFRQRLNRFGSLRAHVSDATSFEVDGEMYSGADGLSELADLSAAAAVVVLGTLDYELRQFNALEVYAGTSVPWGEKDIVAGNVISRNGDVLTIRGASIVRADGSFIFNDNVTVNLSSDTTVVKQADSAGNYSKGDISVGQNVTVLGNISSASTLDITADHVRMHYTNLSGTVVSVSPLAVDLQAIDRRRVVLFDFAGTGTDSANDAEEDSYEVNSGTLSLSNLQNGDPVKVRGFVRSFGQAPEDFTAQTIVAVSNVRAHLAVGYGEGSVNAIASISETGLQLDLTDAGNLHHMYRASVATDLLDLIAMPLIAPRDNDKGLFVIAIGTSLRMYSTYTEFQQALSTALDGATAVISVQTHGVYDEDENKLIARKINVRLAQ